MNPDLLPTLREWRDKFKADQHPVTLALNAAIAELESGQAEPTAIPAGLPPLPPFPIAESKKLRWVYRGTNWKCDRRCLKAIINPETESEWYVCEATTGGREDTHYLEAVRAEPEACKTCKGHGFLPGWTPSYSNPDNQGGAPDTVECPDCQPEATPETDAAERATTDFREGDIKRVMAVESDFARRLERERNALARDETRQREAEITTLANGDRLHPDASSNALIVQSHIDSLKRQRDTAEANCKMLAADIKAAQGIPPEDLRDLINHLGAFATLTGMKFNALDDLIERHPCLLPAIEDLPEPDPFAGIREQQEQPPAGDHDPFATLPRVEELSAVDLSTGDRHRKEAAINRLIELARQRGLQVTRGHNPATDCTTWTFDKPA